MANSSTILNELKQIATRLSAEGVELPRGNVFEVPAGYFDGLPAQIMDRIRAEGAGNPEEELRALSPLLAGLKKETPFSMPPSYFTELSENVLTGMKAVEFVNAELENLSPLMSGLKNKNVYAVPEGYFDTLPALVLQKTKQRARFVTGNFGRRMIRYAAAAAITGLIAVAAWFYTRPASDSSGLASTIDKQTREQVRSLSDDEIVNFADNNTVLVSEASVASSDIDESSIKDLFAEVSDEELQQYLESHGGVSNANNN